MGGTVGALAFSVVDAEYSRVLDKIVAVSSSPNQLHVLDGATGDDTTVALPLSPISVSVGPDGKHAAVGEDGYVTFVDLSQAAVIQTWPVDCAVLDVVLATDYAYAFPQRDQWESIRAVHLSDGVVSKTGQTAIYAGTVAKLHPAGKVLYAADNGVSPSTLQEFDVTAATPTERNRFPYFGMYEPDGELWFSDDGTRIFTRSGAVFRATPDVAMTDMTYNGSLPNLQYAGFVDHSTAASKVAAVPGNPPYSSMMVNDARVYVYDAQYLNPLATHDLPPISAGGRTCQVHARFVFFSADGTKLFALEQADASCALVNDFGLVALAP
jgi:hypothetical protein